MIKKTPATGQRKQVNRVYLYKEIDNTMYKLKVAIILSCLVFLLTNDLFSQDKFKVGIAMGSILPVGEFQKRDNSLLDAGFAESGFTLSFDGDYYFTRRLALTGRFYFGMTSMNKQSNVQWLENQLGESYNDDSVSTSIGYWQWSAPLLGIKYNYPIIINRFYFETGVFTGLNITSVPTQTMKIVLADEEQSIYSENIPGQAFSVPFMADAGFRIMMGEGLQLKINSSWYQAMSRYEHVEYLVNDKTNKVDEEFERYQLAVPLKAFNFNIGLIYNL